jgi:hypothetical protein
VARALKKDPAVRYQDAAELAGDLRTALAELRGREADEPGEGSKTVKLGADGEPTLAAPATAAIATDTRLPVSRHLDSSPALRRLAKSSRTGRAPQPVGLIRRVLRDAAARRLFIVTLIAALAGGFVALA